jgi:hypothetical protein
VQGAAEQSCRQKRICQQQSCEVIADKVIIHTVTVTTDGVMADKVIEPIREATDASSPPVRPDTPCPALAARRGRPPALHLVPEHSLRVSGSGPQLHHRHMLRSGRGDNSFQLIKRHRGVTSAPNRVIGSALSMQLDGSATSSKAPTCSTRTSCNITQALQHSGSKVGLFFPT